MLFLYFFQLFSPSFKEFKQKYTNTGATTQRLPLALSQTHRACICTCARGRLGTPQLVHATTRGKERAEENRWLMEESAFFIRVKWVGAPALQKESVLRGAVARIAVQSKCHLHDSRAISGRAKQRTKNQLEQAGFLLSEMNSS